MKTAILLVVIALLVPLAFAQGQQRDSLIIHGNVIDSGWSAFVTAQIYAVTYDSVSAYRMTLRWNAPLGGVFFNPPIYYFPPVTYWADIGDSVINDSSILMYGFADLGGPPRPPLFTNGMRINIATLRFFLMPGAQPQTISIDTLGSFSFGNNPVFVPGQIHIIRTSAVSEVQPPNQFSFFQNYPNPFNARTTISYSLSQPGPVTLSIYNIMGQKVATVVDEVQEAGEHRVVWDAEDFKSGVYFGRLETSENQQPIKMIVLK
jgi:hypothetical protein